MRLMLAVRPRGCGALLPALRARRRPLAGMVRHVRHQQEQVARRRMELATGAAVSQPNRHREGYGLRRLGPQICEALTAGGCVAQCKETLELLALTQDMATLLRMVHGDGDALRRVLEELHHLGPPVAPRELGSARAIHVAMVLSDCSISVT